MRYRKTVTLGSGVTGNTADSGSVIQGSIPCSPTPQRSALLCCSAVPRNATALRAALLKLRNYQCRALIIALLRSALLLGCSVASRLLGWLGFVNTQQSANCSLGNEIPIIAFWVSAIEVN